MKISALAQATTVPIATIKYYLREGLLHPGRALSRTQADYDQSHIDRIRLIRALTEVGGLNLTTVAHVLTTIEAPDVEHLDVMAAAQRSLHDLVDGDNATCPPDHQAQHPGKTRRPSRAQELATARAWRIDPTDPALTRLDTAWAACEQAGLGLDEGRMNAYADAVEQIAHIDVASVPTDPQAALRQVVLGTVLVDPVLAALRRLAQQHVAVTGHSTVDRDLTDAEVT